VKKDRVQVVKLSVPELCCAEEATQIEKALSSLPGVRQVQARPAGKQVTVAWEGPLQIPDIEQAIRKAGFQVQKSSEPQDTSTFSLPNLLGAVFVSVISVVILVGILGERLGLIEAVVRQIPSWLALSAVLIGGFPIFKKVFLALKMRRVTAHALMTLGIIGAVSIGEFASAAVIVFFMRLADYLESFAAVRARQAIRELIQQAPQVALVERDGTEREVPVEEVKPGDIVRIKPGGRIPVDGTVIEGLATVNQAAITGESLPVQKAGGQEVLAATILERGYLRVRASRIGSETTFGRIIQLMEEAEASKAPVQRFADRFTAYYIPVVLLAAALTYFIRQDFVSTVAVLVVACSCAIAMATPIAVLAGMGRAARLGLIIKGGLYLERLAKIDTVVLDKTGTLTLGKPFVTDILAFNSVTEAEVLELAAVAERHSEHPLAGAILKETNERGISDGAPESFEVIPGEGILATWQGKPLCLGNRRLIQRQKIILTSGVDEALARLEQQGKTAVLVVYNELVMGVIAVADTLRQEVPEALRELKRMGVQEMTILTGDTPQAAAALARQINVPCLAGLLPQDKIKHVKELQARGHTVLMIGDGINDAPALAQSDVAVAMGSGTDVAMETSSVVLMRDDWRMIPEAIRIGRRTFRTIQQNLFFTVLYNVIGISLAAAGLLPPIWAAAAQSLPDVAILLNSSRLLRK
jgi:Cu+-exporting ATPase